MPRTCTVCSHQERIEIDRALLAGESSNRRIAAQYGVGERAIRDHKTNHLAERMQRAAVRNAEADVRTAIDVTGQLRAINGAALAVLKGARDTKDGELALKAIDRIQRQLELQAKLIGDLSDGATVNVTVSAEWLELRGAIITALQPFPQARQAVAERLQVIEGGAGHAADYRRACAHPTRHGG
jgi:hypothetical protein